MSKTPRSMEEIQGEYQKICLQAGHFQYQIETLKKDLDGMNNVLRDLNLEAAASKKLADEKKAAESVPAPSEQSAPAEVVNA